MSLDIRDDVTGVVIISTPSRMSHSGLRLVLEGIVNLKTSRGIMDSGGANNVKPFPNIFATVDLAPAGKFETGDTEIPFEFKLEAMTGNTLYETYNGVFINIQYYIRADLQRGMLAKNLQKQVEFVVEIKSQQTLPPSEPIDFTITPEALENAKKSKNIPHFKMKGQIDAKVFNINKPFTGYIIVEECDEKIRSIEVQLVRVETCGGGTDGVSKESTEIQNIQVADGDPQKGISIPLFMVFPRLFTCPTLITKQFKIEFDVNVVILLADQHVINENFPIKLLRVDESDSIDPLCLLLLLGSAFFVPQTSLEPSGVDNAKSPDESLRSTDLLKPHAVTKGFKVEREMGSGISFRSIWIIHLFLFVPIVCGAYSTATTMRTIWQTLGVDDITRKSEQNLTISQICNAADFIGVTCDGYGNPAQINLYGLALNGSISSSLSSLTTLTSLNLSVNRLTGPIPSAIGSLTSLTVLDLSYNNLIGSIPSSVGNLQSLSYLWLNNNQLNGTIPSVSGLSSIGSLDLSYNSITGLIPSSIGSIKTVQILWLNNNQLNGTFPFIQNLVYLFSLDLSSNAITGSVPPYIGNMTSLNVLWLNNNQLSGVIPPLQNLTSLSFLDLSNNLLSGGIPTSIGNLTSIQYLLLHNNQLSGILPTSIGNLNSLKYLYLYNNQLRGIIPSSVWNLNQLVELALAQNMLTGSISPSISNLTNLQRLFLYNNQFSGSIPSTIGSMSSLSVINLQYNQFSGPLSANFSVINLPNLQGLSLANNFLNGSVTGRNSGLSNLTDLDLSNNNFTSVGYIGVSRTCDMRGNPFFCYPKLNVALICQMPVRCIEPTKPPTSSSTTSSTSKTAPTTSTTSMSSSTTSSTSSATPTTSSTTSSSSTTTTSSTTSSSSTTTTSSTTSSSSTTTTSSTTSSSSTTTTSSTTSSSASIVDPTSSTSSTDAVSTSSTTSPTTDDAPSTSTTDTTSSTYDVIPSSISTVDTTSTSSTTDVTSSTTSTEDTHPTTSSSDMTSTIASTSIDPTTSSTSTESTTSSSSTESTSSSSSAESTSSSSSTESTSSSTDLITSSTSSESTSSSSSTESTSSSSSIESTSSSASIEPTASSSSTESTSSSTSTESTTSSTTAVSTSPTTSFSSTTDISTSSIVSSTNASLASVIDSLYDNDTVISVDRAQSILNSTLLNGTEVGVCETVVTDERQTSRTISAVITALLRNTSSFEYNTRDVSIKLQTYNLSSGGIRTIQSSINDNVAVSLPITAFNSQKVSVSLSSVSFNPFASVQNQAIYSKVVGVSVYSDGREIEIKGTKEKINISMGIIDIIPPNSIAVCQYWNEPRSQWSRDGCGLVVEGDVTICQSDHLTNFSIGIDAAPHQVAAEAGTTSSNQNKAVIAIITCSILGALVLIVVISVTIYRRIYRYDEKDRDISLFTVLDTDGIVFGEKIAEGARGEVWKGTYKETTTVALKKCAQHVDVLRECDVVKALHHPNIVQYLGRNLTENYVVMEWMNHDTLDSYLCLHPQPMLMIVFSIARGLTSALSYLTAMGMVHTRVTPKKVLLSADNGMNVKLQCLSSIVTENSPHQPKKNNMQTAPEIIKGKRYVASGHVYSIGVLLWCMATDNHHLYDDLEDNEVHFVTDKSVDERLAELIAECTEELTEKRPSLSQLSERMRMEQKVVYPEEKDSDLYF
ncbi:hypothetical protein PROFUN_03924 [Planoprotostelium fungivorum]|uniref:LRR receptor-like serine/threonine-protein kinase n=1 Tax=Planoprotostelium fungivorum TaxID=1890364 RepID=A0A2P6MTQ2_9EUKA|nr:hypothetical protein PROFUN_03924 [Planoprotostelium fungivorum]